MTLPRCDHRVPVVDVCEGKIAHRPVLYRPRRGDMVTLTPTVRGTLIVHRGSVIGRIGVDLDDCETWAAFVSDPPGEGFTVLLQPFDVLNCGCVKNLGGWYTRRCLMHPAPDSKPCDHGRSADEGCGQCVIEAARKQRDDRRAAEATW